MLHRAEDFVGGTNADGAGQLGRPVINIEGLRGDMLAKLLAPDFRVTGTTAFEQYHQRGALKAARNIAWVHAFSHCLGELRQYFFGIQVADVLTNFLKLVDADVSQCM